MGIKILHESVLSFYVLNLNTRAALYDLLSKEVDLREKRKNVLARQLEITEVEQALKSAVRSVEDEIKVFFPSLNGLAYRCLLKSLKALKICIVR